MIIVNFKLTLSGIYCFKYFGMASIESNSDMKFKFNLI